MIDIHALSIVNYCHPHCQPLKNIMRLPKEEAFALARELAQKNKNTTAFCRFADFENYYPRRIEADALLHTQFLALGYAASQKHPLSFVFEGSEYLKNWFSNGVETRIPLDGIPSCDISFTFGDSMGVLKRNEPLRLVSKDMLLGEIAAYRGTLSDYLCEIEEKCFYIEVQVWNDESVLSYLNYPSIP